MKYVIYILCCSLVIDVLPLPPSAQIQCKVDAHPPSSQSLYMEWGLDYSRVNVINKNMSFELMII